MNDVQRGFQWAEAIHASVVEFGPRDLTSDEQLSLAEYLVNDAIAWMRAHNRSKAPQQPDLSGARQ